MPWQPRPAGGRRPHSGRRPELTSAAYRRLRQQVIREESVCGRCGLPVDKNLPGTARKGPTMGHIIGYVAGGRLTRSNVRLEHFDCNRRGGTW